mmetsp:Transcript_55291/g.140508  ORF Transcript_55291/g.140508 Transcript_55291/m.140508 type:complete len:131 (+) Transcript_55291:219-611(+)
MRSASSAASRRPGRSVQCSLGRRREACREMLSRLLPDMMRQRWLDGQSDAEPPATCGVAVGTAQGPFAGPSSSSEKSSQCGVLLTCDAQLCGGCGSFGIDAMVGLFCAEQLAVRLGRCCGGTVYSSVVCR